MSPLPQSEGLRPSVSVPEILGFSRWQLFKLLATIVCIVGIVSLALIYFIPTPPSKVVIATAFKGGSFDYYGRQYREIFARSHVELELRETAGAVENVKLIQDPKSGVQIAFVTGGVSDGKHAPGLLSLGTVYNQPFWIFYTSNEPVDRLSQLKGKRIAVGPVGSGTQYAAAQILGKGGINAETATLLPFAGSAAVKALNDGKVDVIWAIGAPDATSIQSFLRNPNVRLMSFPMAEAFTRIFPELARLVLPRGVVDIDRDIPPNDVALIGTTTKILVRSDLHPQIVQLLLQTMVEAHSGPDIFQRSGEFPNSADTEYPVAASARDFYKNGPSFLNRHLPFWMTSYVERTIAVLVASIAIVLPVFSYAPKLYLWFIRDRVRKLYRRLRIIDKALLTELTPLQVQTLQHDLNSIRRAASTIPMRNSELFFDLEYYIDRTRAHIAKVRSKTAGLDDVMHTANEVGLTPSQFHEQPKGSSDANLLKSMLAALQVDPKAITDINPLTMRELRRLCITCDNKKRCEHEFAKGTATEHFREFCPNAASLEALLDQKVNRPHI